MKKILSTLLLTAFSFFAFAEPETIEGIQNFQWTGATTGHISFLAGTGPHTIYIDEEAKTISFWWQGKRYTGHYHHLAADNNLYTAGLDDINE